MNAMSTRNLVILLIPLLLLAAVAFALQPAVSERAESVSSSVIREPAAEELVRDFGLAMKNVSLLAPQSQLRTEMIAAYGEYTAPELLNAWLTNPVTAPGRQTSSPIPARIQIGTTEMDGNVYVVHGTVVEVVNGEGGEEIVGTYPVEVRVENRGGAWLITGFDKGEYSQLPARKTVTGTYTCLPHRDTSGPQTLECAFGVRDENTGEHYAINTMLMASMDWTQIPTEARVRVEGVMVPVESLSTDQWQKYDIVGIISATTIQEL